MKRFRNKRVSQWAALPSEDETVDPRYDFSDPDEESRRQAFVAENERAAEGLLEELAKYGIPSLLELGALANVPMPEHRDVLPILADWLSKLSNQPVRETIVRALVVQRADPHVLPQLVREFSRPDCTMEYRALVGEALGALANAEFVDEYIALAANEAFGASRAGVVRGLGSIADTRSRVALELLLSDADVAADAREALRRHSAKRAPS